MEIHFGKHAFQFAIFTFGRLTQYRQCVSKGLLKDLNDLSLVDHESLECSY